MALGSSSSLFLALCSSSGVAVYLTSELVGFASCLHPLGIHLPRLYRQSEGYIEREKEGGDINWRTKFHW